MSILQVVLSEKCVVRSPSRSADQLGRHQNSSSSKRSAASLSGAEQLVSVETSSMVCTTKLAIAGVRSLIMCVVEDLVVGDEAPVGGVAQVIGHGVKVGVGVHGEEGREKDGEVREEVKGEVEQLKDNRTCAWREDGMTDSRDDLSQCGCDA